MRYASGSSYSGASTPRSSMSGRAHTLRAFRRSPYKQRDIGHLKYGNMGHIFMGIVVGRYNRGGLSRQEEEKESVIHGMIIRRGGNSNKQLHRSITYLERGAEHGRGKAGDYACKEWSKLRNFAREKKGCGRRRTKGMLPHRFRWGIAEELPKLCTRCIDADARDFELG